MTKYRTTDEILADRTLFSKKDVEKIQKNVQKELEKYWGGARKGAGRKCITDKPLKVTLRVSETEKEVIKYARENNIDLAKLVGLKPKTT